MEPKARRSQDAPLKDHAVAEGTNSQREERDRNREIHSFAEDPARTHSRLLTKKQLSDMAWGVELSKRLGSIRLKLKVKTVFILTKAHDESLIKNTREVVRWLLSEERLVRYTVYVEEILRDNKKFDAKGILKELEEQSQISASMVTNGVDGTGKAEGRRLRYWNNDMCRSRPHTFDFVVTLGGDGTVLYASWLFQRIVPPVLSFALGSLGFLTKFDYEDFQGTLTRAFRDGVLVSLRLRFEGTVMRSQPRRKKPKAVTDGEHAADSEDAEEPRDLVEELIGEEKEDEWTHKPDGTYHILNDIVVDRGPNPSKSPVIRHVSLTQKPLQLINHHCSYVLDRNLRRRRTLHLGTGGRRLRRHAHRLHSLQPRGGRLPVPPGKPRHARQRHLRTHALLPAHHPPRHDRPARRRPLRRAHQLVGELRRPRTRRAVSGGLCHD